MAVNGFQSDFHDGNPEHLPSFNSTFAGILNRAQAYMVNDIYLKYLKPDASNLQIRTMNYLSWIIVVLASIVSGILPRRQTACCNGSSRLFGEAILFRMS